MNDAPAIPEIAGQGMRFECWKRADMKPAAYNPRKPLTPADPEYQDIARSIEEFSYSDPIVLNYDGTIIKGHQRRVVMMDKGFTDAWCIVLEIRDKQKEKALNIALNKITGKWDNTRLRDILVELDLEGYDFSTTGFHRDELEDLIRLTEIPPEAQDDDFDPDAEAEQIETPVSTTGDIWQCGRHRVMCGDSTDPEDVAALLRGEQLDLIITDPPYNVDYGAKNDYLNQFDKGNRNSADIRGDHMGNAEFYHFLLTAFQNASDAMRPGAAIYVFHADTVGLTFRQAFKDAGLKMAQCLIWEKNQFVIGRQDYHWRHEPILYGWKEGAAHYFIQDRTQDTVFLEDEIDFKAMKKQELVAFLEQLRREYKDQTTVHFEPKPSRNAMHPTMKPIPLIGRLMNNSSKAGWRIGDFFGGSGSTLMAAEQLGRTAFLMEKDPKYTDVIVRRWEAFTGQRAVILNGV